MPTSVSSKKRVRPITVALSISTISALDRGMKKGKVSRSSLVDEAIREFFKARQKEEMISGYLLEREEAVSFANKSLHIHALDS